MAQRQDTNEFFEVRQSDLSGGVNNSKNETLLALNESPKAVNIDFDQDAVGSTSGSIKFNDQVAPGSAIRTIVDPSLSPLMALSRPLLGTSLDGTVDVPLRGYGYLPYSADTDIGGDYAYELTGGIGTIYTTGVFHNRRGNTFELNVSFRIPADVKLYETPTNGLQSPPVTGLVTSFTPPNGFDEALDECFCIIQKGGDRLAPMSWALAVVNIGNGIGFDGVNPITGLPSRRPSNYGLVFMWYDAPAWGYPSARTMKYDLTSGENPSSGTNSKNCTQAMRAVLIHKYVEPGIDYSVALQLQVDTGTPGGLSENTAWQNNGYFRVWVSENGADPTSYTFEDSSSGGTATGMVVFKGPTDSLSYLTKYGVRYSGRDAMFLGLGMRFTPWMRCGFIPFGMDCAPLRSGGFGMVDRSALTIADLYGAAGNYDVLTDHVAPADAYARLVNQGLSSANTFNGFDPKGGAVAGFEWDGYGGSGGAGIAFGNPEALRGYRIVFNGETGLTRPLVSGAAGAIYTIDTYTEVGASYRLGLVGLAGDPSWVGWKTLIQCFRWHQRDLILGHARIWSSPRAYGSGDVAGARRQLSLRSSIRLDDLTEPDIANLKAYWKCDDAEGATLHESVVGGTRNGFLLPFGNATTDGGSRGSQLVFLSGEGEAITRDLSEDPVYKREIQRMLSGDSQGFGFEISFVETEAFYAIQSPESLPDSGSPALTGARPRGVPDLVCWDVKDPATSGTRSVPRPLLVLSHRNLLSSQDPNAFKQSQAFSVAVAAASDQENIDAIVPSDLLPCYRLGSGVTVNRFDVTSPWVGRKVTIQVGIQRTATADQYDVYISMTPKDAFNPANGDPSDAEFAYWTDGALAGGGPGGYENATYFSAAHLTIDRKDLERSVLTVGGRWNCKGIPSDTYNLGYTELNARMLVDEVRWFATSPAGALPTASGGVTTLRNGKLEGSNCLPPRVLTSDDILEPLGAGLNAANVVQGTTTVTPPSQTSIFTAEPAASERAVKGTYLIVSGDEVDVPKLETYGVKKPEWYGVSAVATGGASLTTRSAYVDPSRDGTVANVFRLVGYTAFEDDVRDLPITLGRGKSYTATGVTVADVILTDDFWSDLSPLGDGWKLRIYSPLGHSSSVEILPKWVRGVVTERRGPEDGILGVYGFNEKVYAAVRGAVYEADDRWRPVDFTPEIQYGLAFRAESLPGGITGPLANDRVVFPVTASCMLPTWSDSFGTILEARGVIDTVSEYQTILWYGDPTSNPALTANNSTGQAVQYILRLNRGRPELVIGSTAAYTGVTLPEKGLFIATADTAVEVGVPFHIRFYLGTRSSGTILLKPYCKINGKKAAVRVNATDVGVSGANDWLLTANIVVPSGASRQYIVGCGRDSYRSADADQTFTGGFVTGTLRSPQRLQGYLHSFNGTLADINMVQINPWSGYPSSQPPDFNPYDIDYDQPGNYLRIQILHNPIGVGHRIQDLASENIGVILSSPFVSVYHAFGGSNKTATWAEFGSQLYVTNGGKPAVIIDGVGMQAGVVAPTVAPKFEVQRFPLWAKNVRATSGTNDLNDPYLQAPVGSAQQIYHQNSVGNTVLTTALDAPNAGLMSWDKDDYFHFKGYIRPRSVAGRIQLWRKANGSQSGGPFIDIVDGCIRFGWYDLDLKKEVYVQSSSPVFQPNDVHYVHVRKRWPIDDLLEVNWQNSYFTDGRVRRMTMSATTTLAVGDIIQDAVTTAASVKVGLVTKINGVTLEYMLLYTGGAEWVAGDPIRLRIDAVTSSATGANAGTPVRPMNDVLTVRRFKRSGESNTGTTAVVGSVRNRVSLTTVTLAVPAGTGASGMASAPGAIYSGALAGVVNSGGVGRAAMGNVFSSDMLGMYWVWGGSAGAAFAGKKYRITTVNTAAQITVIDEETGVNPDFSTITDKQGAVFTGVELVRSDEFTASKTPDNTQTTIEMMGSSIQGDVTSGYAPFDGEFYSFGYGVTPGSASGTNAQCFETLNTSIALNANDPITTGSDAFAVQNYDGSGEPGALQVDSTRSFWYTDGRVYAAAYGGNSSQPNTQLVVESDPHSPSVAPTCTSSATADPYFVYLQSRAEWSAQRQIAVAFYDKTQNIVGDPSPQITIKPEAEDDSNPSGAVRIRLTNLPVAGPDSQVWIYQSVGNGSSGALFRVTKVENGTAEAALQYTDAETSLGPVLEFTNASPPRCDIVETSGSRVVYGALEVQPDACLASKPGFGGLVDYSKVFRLNSGFGATVTGLKDMDGQLVAFKRRAVASVQFDTSNNAVVQPVSGGTGSVAHLSAVSKDGVVIFISDKGFQALTRQGVTNLAMPQWIGEKLRNYFTDSVDNRGFDRMAACLNQKRKQYVLALKLKDETHQFARVSLETDQDKGLRYSTYEHPNVTALTSVQSPDGGTDRMVAGTEEGFVVWLDDDRTEQALLGANLVLWGSPRFFVGSETTTAGCLVEPVGDVDATLDNVRGALLRWTNADGEERLAWALDYDGEYLHYEDVLDEAIATDTEVSIGNPGYVWESAWMDLGLPEKRKGLAYVTCIMRGQTQGSVLVELMRDFDDSVLLSQTLNLNEPPLVFNVGSVDGNWFKVRLTVPDLAYGVRFELASLVWRFQITEQTQP